MEYKRNLEQAVDRQCKLWRRELRRGILATIEPEEAPLSEAATEAARAAPDLAAMLAAWDYWLSRRRDLQDDSMPVARVSFGSNAFGGFLGAEVVFGEGGGWSRPLLDDWSKLDALRYDPDAPWLRRQQEACRYFLQHYGERFALCESETIDGLNFTDVLRGTDRAMLDIYDYPEELHRLMSFGVDFNAQLIRMQRQILGQAASYRGGVFLLHYVWIPGPGIWLSVDSYTLCRAQVFERFGRAYIQALIDRFGSGWLHVHARGIHLLPALLKLRSLWGISICDDPGEPRPFEQLPEIIARAGGMPLEIWCHADELRAGMRDGTLPGGVLYRVDQVQSVREANLLMGRVRDYQAPVPEV